MIIEYFVKMFHWNKVRIKMTFCFTKLKQNFAELVMAKFASRSRSFVFITLKNEKINNYPINLQKKFSASVRFKYDRFSNRKKNIHISEIWRITLPTQQSLKR